MTGPGDRPGTRSSVEATLPGRRTRERCSGGRHTTTTSTTTTTTTITTATAETRERCVPRYTSAAAAAEAVSRPNDFLRSIIIIVIITRSAVCEIISYHPTTRPHFYTHVYRCTYYYSLIIINRYHYVTRKVCAF